MPSIMNRKTNKYSRLFSGDLKACLVTMVKTALIKNITSHASRGLLFFLPGVPRPKNTMTREHALKKTMNSERFTDSTFIGDFLSQKNAQPLEKIVRK
jgi:hypothetical protein